LFRPRPAASVVIDVGRSAAFGIAYTRRIRLFIDCEAEFPFAPTSTSFADAAAKANAGPRLVNIYPRLQNGHAAVEVTVLQGTEQLD
jgi:hypothetical protein